MTAPNPMGCHWCGIDQRTHGRQWTPDAGWHTWTQPTQEQIKNRMRARRSARTERIRHSGPDTKFCVLCLSGEHQRIDATSDEE
ncbi:MULTISPECIES: hypothetical protein [Streptomyces]|uniref:Uncharacterized protein n=1 Tax=Streptomyces bacillaris TaxID=68179 RepID=A0ABW6DQ11_9ACTN|nr:hypothetical protein [Streptomyces nanshensis]